MFYATLKENVAFVWFTTATSDLEAEKLCLLTISETLQGIHEKRLLNDLLNEYNTLERPVADEKEPLRLSFGLTLMQIIDVVSTTSFEFLRKHTKNARYFSNTV